MRTIFRWLKAVWNFYVKWCLLFFAVLETLGAVFGLINNEWWFVGFWGWPWWVYGLAAVWFFWLYQKDRQRRLDNGE